MYFRWKISVFGLGARSSYFQDMAIIDENDIWAVGEVHTRYTDQFDFLSHWVQPSMTSEHWDGQKWIVGENRLGWECIKINMCFCIFE